MQTKSMKQILLSFFLCISLLGICQTKTYDSLYQSGAISKEDYNTILSLHKSEQDSSKKQIEHYDSLYHQHLLSKEEYELLKFKALSKSQSNERFNPIKIKHQATIETAIGITLMGVGIISFASVAARNVAKHVGLDNTNVALLFLHLYLLQYPWDY